MTPTQRTVLACLEANAADLTARIQVRRPRRVLSTTSFILFRITL